MFSSRRGGTSDHLVLRRELVTASSSIAPPLYRHRPVGDLGVAHVAESVRLTNRPCTRPAATCWSQPTCADVRTAAMERALLVRHAESVFSARGLATGRVDVRCPLSERGEAQARALTEDLANEGIDLCVTSELEQRANRGDHARGEKVPRIVLPELNDPLYGRYEGVPLDAYLAWALANDSAASLPAAASKTYACRALRGRVPEGRREARAGNPRRHAFAADRIRPDGTCGP